MNAGGGGAGKRGARGPVGGAEPFEGRTALFKSLAPKPLRFLRGNLQPGGDEGEHAFCDALVHRARGGVEGVVEVEEKVPYHAPMISNCGRSV